MDVNIKILAICGSPRRSNTYEILEMLKDSYPEINFKILMLSDLNLMDCVGCYSCINSGEETCPLVDDRDLIIEEMMAADGIIFASPTYARTISALMKKFVERTSYIAHRPIFFGKYAISLVTYSGFGADLTSKYLTENFSQCGFQFVNSLELKTSAKSEVVTTYNQRKALRGCEKLIKSIRSHEKFKPTLGQLVYFNIFKSIAVLNKVKGRADYEFYKNKKDFYFDIKIPFVKNRIAQWIANREFKKMIAHI